MLCCNRLMSIIDTIPLDNEDIYYNRKIYVRECMNCKKKKYQLSEVNSITGAIELDRNKPKRLKNTEAWLNNLLKLSYESPLKIKKGSKSAMAFIFGSNKMINKKPIQIGYDFNGTERNRNEAKEIFCGVE